MDADEAADRVRTYYDAIDGDDYDRLATVLRPEFTHVRPDRTIEGRGRFLRFMREERPVTGTTHAIDAVFPEGVGVAVQGRLLDPDDEVMFAFVDVFTFEDGGVAGLETYTEPLDDA